MTAGHGSPTLISSNIGISCTSTPSTVTTVPRPRSRWGEITLPYLLYFDEKLINDQLAILGAHD